MDDVDDETVSGSSKRKGPRGHQQSHDVEEVGEMSRHVQGVVEGQHEHVPRQDRDVVPHQVLLQRRRWRQTRLVNDFTHPADHLRAQQPFCVTELKSRAQQLSKNHYNLTLQLFCCLQPIL